MVCSGIEYQAKNYHLVEGSNPRLTSSVGMSLLIDTGGFRAVQLEPCPEDGEERQDQEEPGADRRTD